MQKYVLILFLLLLFSATEAQPYITYDIEPDVVKIMEAYSAAWKKVGQTEGYRVQIAALASRSAAQTVANDFTNFFSSQKVYVKYFEPNFRVRAGNFLTRLEAYNFLKQIEGMFPGAFVTPDQISIKDNY
ncbi:MAG: SPOR domain-containing protein [Bacteroidales bacterium]|nr:SPOR domain-containing protein [Bacteroidales bacterium]